VSTLERPRQIEIASSGFDEYLQLVGSDPFAGPSPNSVGLRVPGLPTPALSAGGAQLRYLFNLASFTVGDGACVKIRGYRQLATLGFAQKQGSEEDATVYVVEQEIVSPFWRFTDGNISWHIHVFGGPNASDVPKGVTAPYTDVARDVVSYKRYWADSPCLLYGPGSGAAPGNIYQNIATYVPPNNGKPWGSAIASKQGTFYDLRTPWRTHGALDSLDIPVRGPATVAFFASVRQSNPETRDALSPPGGDESTFYAAGLSAEEQFLLNFPDAIYWRVGGSLILELA
jgi:hypothetical protein